MRQSVLHVILAIAIVACIGLNGSSANEPMSPDQMAKKLQQVNAQPPAEVKALIPEGATQVSLNFGPDYGTFSFARVEFLCEILNKDAHLHDRAELRLECNVVDPDSQMGKMVFINAYQAEQQQKIERMRSEMKTESSATVKWEEVSTPFGKIFAKIEKWVEGGELGKNENPREEHYYSSTYIGRSGNAFFVFQINTLPLASKTQATAWSDTLAAHLGKLNAARLCRY
jgi:hypothetical protein